MHHRRQTNEIHTFTRGRQCSDDGRQCTTALIDDYRYERATLETNAAEVHPIVVLLRSVAQIYVWIRLGFLITLLKVPSHVVVYSSLLPVLCYVVPYFLECGILQLVFDVKWSSYGGKFDFSIVDFVTNACIEMRNVWVLGLAAKVLVFATTPLHGRTQLVWPGKSGALGVRGLTIGTVSMLTIWAPLRSLSFRDSRVLEIVPNPRSRIIDIIRADRFPAKN
ncbi:TPA: hypothetical protein N0F65_010838 [Lagenidium giganteum]|uniref:Uncharacterized protein n=1 Tax=Lagenidium giganteum TaxID=4803 RepID=A0AAV2Z4M5_9STRA|nr:TPA: hypothetical protein N0F65_010838 [Lagenidium giganteum]